VLDAGTVFQYAALVAREYRIPAVIMTREQVTDACLHCAPAA
jgi:phosphoenolpyruvate synthase/pyruvate phosphate dikinase